MDRFLIYVTSLKGNGVSSKSKICISKRVKNTKKLQQFADIFEILSQKKKVNVMLKREILP